MSNLALFNFEGANVRVVDISGEPWFVAKDVAQLLGYARTADAIRTHCKGVGEAQTPTDGGYQTIKIIPERDVYRLVMRSKLPAAERFEEWVVGTVLPSIRKTGSYDVMADPRFNIPQTYPDALRALASTVEENENLKSVNQELNRTKAYIGNKREASAMAKASVLSRKLKKAEEMLGDSANWKTTKAIHWLLDCFENAKPMYQQVGKYLTRLSAAMDREVKKVESTNYGSVKSYHIDVINAFEVQLSSDPELLGKYRKA